MTDREGAPNVNARMKPQPEASAPLGGRLPMLAVEDAGRLRRLASQRRRFALPHGAGAWVEIMGPHADPAPWVLTDAGDARLGVALTDDRDGDAAADFHWSDFDGDSRLVAWALAHERALAWLGDVLGTRLLPIEIVDGEPIDSALTIGVRLGDDGGIACEGALRVSAEWLDRLLADERGQDIAIGPAGGRAAAGIAAPLTVSLEGPSLRLAELKSLRAGDVIVVGTRGALENVRIDDGARTWRARLDESQLHVIEAGAVPHRSEWRKPMNAVNEESGDTARGVADIPVRVEFAIGEVTLPFGELEHVEPGYVFELGRAIEGASVDIRANGTRIGRGQIVAIGDTLGVRITDCGADGLQ
jgi:type III secretion protein Q